MPTVILQPETEPLDQLAPDGFIMIRNGIRDHINAEQFTAVDLGVYLFLHAFCTWRTGICFTNATSIANKLGVPERTIQRSFARLRENKYINFVDRQGQHGSYPILIHKYRVALGTLSGHELNAFATTEFPKIVYTDLKSGDALVTQWCRGGDVDESVIGRSSVGDRSPIVDGTIRGNTGKASTKTSKKGNGCAGVSKSVNEDDQYLKELLLQAKLVGKVGTKWYLGKSSEEAIAGYNNKAELEHDLFVVRNPDLHRKLDILLKQWIKRPKAPTCPHGFNLGEEQKSCPNCNPDTCAHGKPLEHGRCACPAFETECDECGQSHPNLPCTHKRVPKPCSFCKDAKAETVPYEAETERWICLECSNGGNYGD